MPMLPAKSTASTKVANGCLGLFLLPFALIGLGMLGWTAWLTLEYLQMQGWVEAPATLVDLQAKGDDSINIQAQFNYEYQGKKYTGTRVAVHRGGDNIGPFQRRLLRSLENAKGAGKKVPCYVNPHAPSQAVLNRDLRPLLMLFKGMFGLVFGVVGVGGKLAVWIGGKRLQRAETLAAEFPDEPWKVRDDWSSGIVQPRDGGHLVGLLIFGGLWNLVSWPVAIAAFLDDRKIEWYVWLLVGMFPFIGLCFIAAVLLKWLRWRAHRGCYFRLAHTPGVVGGQLAGVIVAPRVIQPAAGFRLALRCEQQTGSGDDRRTECLWEDELPIARTLEGDAQETAIPVAFTIPSSALPTDKGAIRKCLLTCHADLPGPNLDVTFEVPVFRTADSQEGIEYNPSPSPIAEFETQESLVDLLARQRVRMEQGRDADETLFITPPARNWVSSLAILAFGLGALYAGIAFGGQRHWFMAMMFFAFGLLFTFLALDMLLAYRVVTIRRDRWRVQSGLWPWLWRQEEFTADQIVSFSAKSHMSTNDKSWNQVLVEVQGRKKPVVLSHGITSRWVERQWLADLRQRAGLTPDGE